jgi:prepilin-type N-terminal cleavage/methylation domain-containing protein
MRLKEQRGFSLLELMITVSIALILMGVAFIGLQPIMFRSNINTAYDTVLMVLRDTRHLAITQSHEYKVSFDAATNTIRVDYQPPSAGGIAPPLQLVQTYSMPVDMSFGVRAGFPASTPDGFGTGVTAVDFGQTLAGSPFNYVAFYPDGSARDMAGNYNNGVLYITRAAGTIYDSRAISVWGSTGRVRGWTLDQPGGVATWVQQ